MADNLTFIDYGRKEIKKIKANKIVIILTCILVLTLVGCATSSYKEAVTPKEVTEQTEDYFTILVEWTESGHMHKIVYANDTKVKYLIISGSARSGITPLYNADGTLQLYEE